MNNSEDLKNIFILSTGRTGSTFISEFLSNLKGNSNIEHQVFGSRFANIVGNFVCAKKMSLKKATYLTKDVIGLNFDVSTSDPLRSMLLYAYLQTGEIEPNILIVHIVRDPRDFVTSFMNWKNQSLKRRLLHHFVPFWQPTPWLVGESSFTKRNKMNKFEHYCWVWNYKNRLFMDLEGRFKYHLFKFEDFFNESREAKKSRKNLFSYLGIGTDNVNFNNKKKVNPSKKNFPAWTSWTPEQAIILDKHCGDLMEKYGYGKEQKWKQLLKDE